MITPNKVVRIADSALGKAKFILEKGPQAISVHRLYEDVSSNFESIDQFILTLDLLFVLRRIDVDPRTATVTYVD